MAKKAARKVGTAATTLTFIVNVGETESRKLSVYSTIYFNQDIKPSHVIRKVNNTIPIAQNLADFKIIKKSVTSKFKPDHWFQYAIPRYVTATSNLNLVQNTKRTIAAGIASNTLALGQGVTAGIPKIVTVPSALVTYSFDVARFLEGQRLGLTGQDLIDYFLVSSGLKQSVSIKKILNSSVESIISFEQGTAPSTLLIVNNQIHLSQLVEKVLHEPLVHLLNLTSVASYNVTNKVSSILALTHSVNETGVLGRGIVSNIPLNSIVSFNIRDLCEYSPGVGAGPAAPSMVDPVLVRKSTITLSAGTKTLSLKAPNFDNVEQFEVRKVNRRSRGGTLQIYRDPNWPSAERLIMTFSALKQEEVKNLLLFMNTTLGKEVDILDFESRQWRGIILTPPAAISEPGTQGFSASFEFEGVKI